jgi:hypothetical protein
MSKAWARGSTAAWRKLRARILQANLLENQGQCQIGIEGVCTGQANTVHHTLGRAVTGDDPKYLGACCSECNLKIGEPKQSSPPHRTITKW